MITFDLYRPHGTRSEKFFESAVRAGTVVGLESAGFREGYFGERQTQEMIAFAVLPGPGTALPTDVRAFEQLSLIEAEVGEHDNATGKVTVRGSLQLGEWARAVYLGGKAGFDQLPEPFRPPAQVVERLKDELRARESVLWVSGEPLVRTEADVSAVCLMKCDSGKRGLVVATSAASSFLLKI